MRGAARPAFRLWAELLAFTVMLAAVTSGFDTSAGAGGRPLHSPSQLGAPSEVRGKAAANAWPLPDHDYLNSRDAGVSPIRGSTVSRLVPAWSVPMAAGASTSPIVVAGTAYLQDQAGTCLLYTSRCV